MALMKWAKDRKLSFGQNRELKTGVVKYVVTIRLPGSEDVLRRIPTHPVTELDELLPHRWAVTAQ